MNKIALTDNGFKVSGALTFLTVRELWEECQHFFKQEGDLIVDLSAVENSDSAALALLLEWQRLAQQHHKKIQFQRLPQQLITVARLCGVDQILEII